MSEITLESIEKKLDLLIALFKIGISEQLNVLKSEVEQDEVSKKVLVYADDTLSYNQLKYKVAEDLDVHEITVRRRIADLSNRGLIIGRRVGREVYYKNSGLIEV